MCRIGLKIAMADVDEARLAHAAKEVGAIANVDGATNVIFVPTDVSQIDQVVRLKERVYETWGEVRIRRTALCDTSDATVGGGPDQQRWRCAEGNVMEWDRQLEEGVRCQCLRVSAIPSYSERRVDYLHSIVNVQQTFIPVSTRASPPNFRKSNPMF